MGSNCSCFHDNTKNPEVVTSDMMLPEFENDANLKERPESLNIVKTFEGDVIVEVDFDLYQIIWLQSILRGFLERHKAKKHYQQNNVAYRKEIKKATMNNSKRGSMEIKFFAREMVEIPLDDVPDYLTQAAKAMQVQLGPYAAQMKSEKGLKKKGPIMVENKAIYTGTWSSVDQRHGRGVLISPDGSIYEGYWRNDTCNGKGRKIKSNGDYYEGDWKDDLYHGYGLFKQKDGSYYEGEYKYGGKCGQGTELINEISTYKGQFYNDEKSGDGKIAYANGDWYEGNFAGGEFEGFGKFVWSDGRCYEGDWTEGKMHGRGIFSWPDGRYYEGDYEMDKKHGTGLFKWPDGRMYEGGWKNDKQDGEGVYSTNIGTKKGVWKNGRRIND